MTRRKRVPVNEVDAAWASVAALKAMKEVILRETHEIVRQAKEHVAIIDERIRELEGQRMERD